MMRETITTNADHTGNADGTLPSPRYALAYAPGDTRATLKESAAQQGGVVLTAKLAGELIDDLTIFIDQAKRTRARARPRKAATGASVASGGALDK